MGNIYLEQLIKMAAEESAAYQKVKSDRAKAGKDMETARNQRVSDAPRLKEPLTPAQKKILAIQEEKANATKAQEAKAANDAKISKMKAESNARSTAPVKPDPSTRPFTMVEPEKAKPGANARERMAAKVEERNAGSNKARLDNALKNSGAGEVKVTMADASHNPSVKINNHAGFNQLPQQQLTPAATAAAAATPKTNFNANNVQANGKPGFGLPQQGQGGHTPGGTTPSATEAKKAVPSAAPKAGPEVEHQTADHLSALRKMIPKSMMGKVGLGLAGLSAVGAVAAVGHNKAAEREGLANFEVDDSVTPDQFSQDQASKIYSMHDYRDGPMFISGHDGSSYRYHPKTGLHKLKSLSFEKAAEADDYLNKDTALGGLLSYGTHHLTGNHGSSIPWVGLGVAAGALGHVQRQRDELRKAQPITKAAALKNLGLISMTNRYLEKIAADTAAGDAAIGLGTGLIGEKLSRKYAPKWAVGHGTIGYGAAGVIGAGVQMGLGAAQRHFQEKKALDMPLKDLIKEHKDLVGVLKSNNRADELKELKEQGAELTKLEKLAAFGIFAKDSIGDIISRTPAGSWKDYTRLVGANNYLDTAYYRAFRRNHMHFPESVPERGYYEAQAKRLSESKIVESAIPGALNRVNTAGVHFGLERPRDVPHLTHFDLRGQT